MNGGVPVYCPIRPKGDIAKDMSASEWKVDIKELESKITPRSKILVLNTPHNPIGKVFSQEELEEIGALATKHNLLIISDEVVSRSKQEYWKFLIRFAPGTKAYRVHSMIVRPPLL